VLIVRYQLSSGESGEDVLVGDAKWTFGRPGADEPPTVPTDDSRISRNALVIRDSGPGPVVFRGQRGDAARVGLISNDGTTEWLSEAKAGHMTDEARRVEFHLGEEHIITVEVDFADRGSVKQRQRQQMEEAADADPGTDTLSP
jgi:hypothetical protein